MEEFDFDDVKVPDFRNVGGGNCVFNVAVMCSEIRCNKCGWCPAVEKERKKKIREELLNESDDWHPLYG